MKQGNLLLNRFVKLVEVHHEEITERFMNDLLKNSETPSYRGVDRLIIYEVSDKIYRDLSIWISREYSKAKVAERYLKIGKERYEMGIPFPEACKAIILQRRHLWLFVMDKIYDGDIAIEEAIELNNRVTLYFDRALFFMLTAYNKMIYREV